MFAWLRALRDMERWLPTLRKQVDQLAAAELSLAEGLRQGEQALSLRLEVQREQAALRQQLAELTAARTAAGLENERLTAARDEIAAREAHLRDSESRSLAREEAIRNLQSQSEASRQRLQQERSSLVQAREEHVARLAELSTAESSLRNRQAEIDATVATHEVRMTQERQSIEALRGKLRARQQQLDQYERDLVSLGLSGLQMKFEAEDKPLPPGVRDLVTIMETLRTDMRQIPTDYFEHEPQA